MIDNEEIDRLFDRIDQVGAPLQIYVDPKGRLKTRSVVAKFRPNLPRGCKLVGVYDIGASYLDVKADVEFVKGYTKERHALHLKTVKDALERVK